MKTIALIYGGNSKECEISVLSGKNIASHIDRTKYRVFEILLKDKSWTVQNPAGDGADNPRINKDDFSFVWQGRKIRFDVALIMVHGTPGEDGLLQSYLELLHIPHTSCPASTSLMTFDKYACKALLRDAGICLPREVRLQKSRYQEESAAGLFSARDIIRQTGLPLFVKPNMGGSSYGISRVNTEEALQPAIEKAFAYDRTVLVETCIEGRELTNGVFKAHTPGGIRHYRLPVTEIIPSPDCEFFDYEAKYYGKSREITPAVLEEELRDRIQETSSFIYDYLNCSGIVRMDYILRKGPVGQKDELFFLEVNTVPGMTPMSLVPQELRAAGYSLEDFLEALIEDACQRQLLSGETP